MVHTLLATMLCSNAFAGKDDDAPEPVEAVTVAAPSADARFVAVVVGLSSYEKLPDAVELDFARSDAAVVHKYLKERANFDETFLLTDGEATLERLKALLRTEVAQLVGPDDVFVLYFVGHGVGADLDAPALLVFDSTLENAQEDGLELNAFAQDLQTWTQAGTTLVVTDAIHSNQLDGVYFFGPAANQWPKLTDNTMILSSSQADSPAKDGAFGTVFADAMAGAADGDKDGFVTAAELESYVVGRMSPVGQLPVSAGEFNRGMVVARGVKNTGATDPSTTSAPIPDAKAAYPDVTVWSAKFVFREGASQSVQCNELPVKSCTPSCYVRDFKAGICELKAVVDGAEMSGKVPVIFPGKYDCGLRYGLLTCKPPLQAAEASEQKTDPE